MVDVRVTRTARVPDPLRVQRYHKAPELGPKLLFFSGGSALNGISRRLQHYTHNSIHLVTPFDSGGSSAKLRKAFGMPAIGDLRSRLMALADDSILGHPEVCRLFTYRLPEEAEPDALRATLDTLARGQHPLTGDISNPMRRLICNQLGFFLEAMPDDFDLRGASIGNLILAGGYLNNHQQLDPITFLFSKLVHVRGTVRAIIDQDYHLAATLTDGCQVLGQHRITGKEVAPLVTPIARLELSADRDTYEPVTAKLHKRNQRLIASAELICYPPGSFYSSLLANLLPHGVGRAIHANRCPKVFIPNSSPDPEQAGMDLERQITTLLDTLHRDIGETCPTRELLDFVLIDSERGDYPGQLSPDFLAELGVTLIDTRLIGENDAPLYDPDLLVTALLSLV
ncbi:GAK system CofD-like protein [Halomonas eurihalina]|uniref:GAK system CofD-like protein n=1 Tax=Halomonas eurihalina TaxID=42566 RepID=A0A5D9CYB2_HALER|nr:GAK system CofD-like protein [Halomonas eurihalina]MDR5860896.1 GAK system CofD-like protein [Halomonas eurihalina]TZG35880.1 GAK system CofD-like protein [Halomonas eurihalina]